jgi:translation initiation factor IF-2
MPVRIYDIAKKLGIESKEVLAKAKDLGIAGARVPSSSLDKITAAYLEENLAGAVAAKPEPAPPAPPEPVLLVTTPAEPPPAPPEPMPAPLVETPPEVTEPEPPPVAVTPPAPEPPEVALPAPAPEPEPAKDEIIAPEEAPPQTEPDSIVQPPPAEPEPAAEPAPAPVVVPEPVPQAPRLGEKVGFIQLPQRPVSRSAMGRSGLSKPPAQPVRPARPAPSLAQPAVGRPVPKPAERPQPKFSAPVGAQVITLKPPITVRDMAEALKRKPFQIIADLMELGVFATVNQAVEEPIAQQICAKHGFRFEVEKRERGAGIIHAPRKPVEIDLDDKLEDLKLRAPVVTIMGHVDHGKTTLLDVIRKSNVAAGEAGGITQHIGAYTISFPHPERKSELQQITFLDTPGHAAFSSMRARGANVTDIVVLVVAANDGVMPQTLEALSHAKAAGAHHRRGQQVRSSERQPDAVRKQLQEKGWCRTTGAANTIFVDVSALTKQGVDKLLEMILLQADLLELKANPDRRPPRQRHRVRPRTRRPDGHRAGAQGHAARGRRHSLRRALRGKAAP